MSVFSSGSKAHQFYVTKSVSSALATLGASTFTGIGAAASAPEIVYQQLGHGGPVRSDLIKVSTISNIRVTKGSSLKKPLRKTLITLKTPYINSTNVNTTTLPVGTACIARITFYQYGAISMEDQLSKIASATVSTSMTLEQFYIELKDSLVANFKHETVQTLNFTLDGVKASHTQTNLYKIQAKTAGTAGNSLKYTVSVSGQAGANPVAVKTGDTWAITLASDAKTIADLFLALANNTEIEAVLAGTGATTSTVVAVSSAATLTGGSATGVLIQEVAQPFSLGKKSSQPLTFKIESTSSDIVKTSPVTIENISWAEVTEQVATEFISASYDIAEREYFFLGERGDVYRGMGYPNNMDINYMVDLTKTYNLIDFDFFYTGGGLHPQESPKHITIACEESGETSYTNTNALIAALNTASGLSIGTL